MDDFDLHKVAELEGNDNPMMMGCASDRKIRINKNSAYLLKKAEFVITFYLFEEKIILF